MFESNVNYDLGKTNDVRGKPCIGFESNVNYDLGKTSLASNPRPFSFESNVNYDLGKTSGSVIPRILWFESNVNYNFKGPLQAENCEFKQHKETICQEQMLFERMKTGGRDGRAWSSPLRRWGRRLDIRIRETDFSMSPFP